MHKVVLRNLPWQYTRSDVVKAVQRNFEARGIKDAYVLYDKDTGLSRCRALLHVEDDLLNQMQRKGLFYAEDRPVYVEAARGARRKA